MSANNEIYRKETCSFGKKAVALLQEKSIPFEDHIFDSKAEEEALKSKYNVSTTPQIFIDGERIGGFSDLQKYFGDTKGEPAEDKQSYQPVIAVFSVTALLSLATSTGLMGFMGFSLTALALLKLMDVKGFIEGFEKYDLLTQVFRPYGYLYPFLELAAGLGFLSGVAPITTGGLSTFVGLAGGISVFKAVYIDKQDLNCACVGGNNAVPLGFISFTENAMMVGMGIYWLQRFI